LKTVTTKSISPADSSFWASSADICPTPPLSEPTSSLIPWKTSETLFQAPVMIS